MRSAVLAMAIAMLARCDGGGTGTDAPAVPASVSVSVPTAPQAIGTTLARSIVGPTDSYRVLVASATDVWSFQYSSPALLHSVGGGASWQASTPPPPTSGLSGSIGDLQILDAAHALWIGTESGATTDPSTFVSHQAFSITADGGASWQSIVPPPGFGNFSANLVDATTIVAYSFASPPVRSDAQHGVAVGPGGIALVTTDGGSTWSPRPTGTGNSLQRVTFPDSRIAVAVGQADSIVRSIDAGQTWTVIDSPTSNTLNDVRFLTATSGRAVGDAGTELITNDGGLTWSLGAPGPQASLRSVFFVDEQTGWISGYGGGILATATGGR